MTTLYSPVIETRPATLEDAAAISAIGTRMFPKAHEGALAPDDLVAYTAMTFSRARILADLTDPAALYLVAAHQRDGKLCGFVKLVYGRACASAQSPAYQTVEFSKLYLEDSWMGQGVGSALVHAVIAELKGSSAKTCWLEVWEHNERAQQFYRRFGFQVVGATWRGAGKSRAKLLVMTRALNTKLLPLDHE